MADSASSIYALVDYADDYVQPLILRALTTLPRDSYRVVESITAIPARARTLQIQQYEELPFEQALSSPTTHLVNSYVIRKALIRKHYLSATVAHWTRKNPHSLLSLHVKPSTELEVDYAEFLDEALLEAYELKDSWKRNEELPPAQREWWILKPGMSDRGEGIRLFSSEEELTSIFEDWEESDDEHGDFEDESECADHEESEDVLSLPQCGDRVITSHLRHFIAQPYIHPPLLLPSAESHKFHIRTYVLAVGSLKVYVYKEMLALFAAEPYVPPWDNPHNLRIHLTNTCLQGTDLRAGSVREFWKLEDCVNESDKWKEVVYDQVCRVTSEVFEAAARSMTIHFQSIPNAFEVFGVDFLLDIEGNAYLLEINAFPDFRQTGDELHGLILGLFENVVQVAVRPFFGLGNDAVEGTSTMRKVLELDLGRK